MHSGSTGNASRPSSEVPPAPPPLQGAIFWSLPPAVAGGLFLFLFEGTQHDSLPDEGALGISSKEMAGARPTEPSINREISSSLFAATGPCTRVGDPGRSSGPPAHSWNLKAETGPASPSWPHKEPGAGGRGSWSWHVPSWGFGACGRGTDPDSTTL